MPTLEKDTVFYSKWLRNKTSEKRESIPIKVISIDELSDTVRVDYGSGAGPATWELSIVLTALEINEYSFTPFN